MADAAENLLYQNLPQGVNIRVDRIQERPETAFGTGSGIV